MKRTKLLLVAAMVLPLFLSACNGKKVKDPEYRDDLLFTEESLTVEERDTLLSNIVKAADKINSIETIEIQREKDAGYVFDYRHTQKATIYSNNYVSGKFESTKLETRYGYGENLTEKGTCDYWIDEPAKASIYREESNFNKQIVISQIEESQLEGAKELFYDQVVLDSFSNLQYCDAYKKGKGFIFVGSAKTVEEIPIELGENITKIQKNVYESQLVVEINKNFQITSFTTFERRFSNMYSNYEFLDELAEVYYDGNIVNFTYKGRKVGAISKARADLEKPFVYSTGASAAYGHMENGEFVEDGHKSLSVNSKRISAPKFHAFVCLVIGGQPASPNWQVQGYAVVVPSIDHLDDAQPIEFTVAVENADAVEGVKVGPKDTLEVDNDVMVAVTIGYDFEATRVDVVAVSNVKMTNHYQTLLP